MDITQAIDARHSVRSYQDKPIEACALKKLQSAVDAINEKTGLHFQLVTGEPKAFDSMMAHYGKFSGVQNYIALVGKDTPDVDEKAGFYGEELVLLAQQLGLNTCWVAMTFSKKEAKKHIDIQPGEKLVIVIALGYGAAQGIEHKSKFFDDVAAYSGTMPVWFRKGVDAALKAPTAMNQQKFKITGSGNSVNIKNLGGFYSKIDLGIVKKHFELGAGKDSFIWQD